jgi:hypothetical protein
VGRLEEFRRRALTDLRVAVIETFPGCPEQALQSPWRRARDELVGTVDDPHSFPW